MVSLGHDGSSPLQRAVLGALRDLGATASRGVYVGGREVLGRALGSGGIPSVEELLAPSPAEPAVDDVVARAFAFASSRLEREDPVIVARRATVHEHYLTLVHMSQAFRSVIPLVDVRGNNGSLDGDPPADLPYTEWRLSAACERLTDARGPRVPLGFVTGLEGILPAFQVASVARTLLALLRDPDAALLLGDPVVPIGSAEWRDPTSFPREGVGELLVRGDAHIEGDLVVVSSLPWLVSKATWHARAGAQMRRGEAPALDEIHDESERGDVRLVVAPQRGRSAEALAWIRSALFAEHRVALRLDGDEAPTPPRTALLRFLERRRVVCGREDVVRGDLHDLLG